jgi:hypothetical protein
MELLLMDIGGGGCDSQADAVEAFETSVRTSSFTCCV